MRSFKSKGFICWGAGMRSGHFTTLQFEILLCVCVFLVNFFKVFCPNGGTREKGQGVIRITRIHLLGSLKVHSRFRGKWMWNKFNSIFILCFIFTSGVIFFLQQDFPPHGCGDLIYWFISEFLYFLLSIYAFKFNICVTILFIHALIYLFTIKSGLVLHTWWLLFTRRLTKHFSLIFHFICSVTSYRSPADVKAFSVPFLVIC